MTSVRLRPAVVDDIVLLRQWDEDPDVAASSGEDGDFDWEFEVPRAVPWRELLIAEVGGEPIGFLQLIDALEEESHYWGRDEQPGAWAIDIWIGTAAHRGRGFGAEMMRQALARCFDEHGASTVLIDPLESNTRALRFYERLGFTFVEHRTFDTDFCRVYRFDRTSWPRARSTVRDVSNERVHRVTVRGRFRDLSDESRRYLTRHQTEHDIFVAAYTAEGTLTYDERVLFFNLRYEIRCAADADPALVALAEAETFLRTMGFGHTELKADVVDVSAIWDDVARGR